MNIVTVFYCGGVFFVVKKKEYILLNL